MSQKLFLYETIHSLCIALDVENNIPDKDKLKMADSLTTFCTNAINKFIIGQKKHGGNIVDRNLDKEFQQEFIDMFWYMNAKNWQQNEKEEKENETRSSNKETEEINTSQVEQQSNCSRSQ